MAGERTTTTRDDEIRRWSRPLAFLCQDQTKERETSRFFKSVRG